MFNIQQQGSIGLPVIILLLLLGLQQPHSNQVSGEEQNSDGEQEGQEGEGVNTGEEEEEEEGIFSHGNSKENTGQRDTKGEYSFEKLLL